MRQIKDMSQLVDCCKKGFGFVLLPIIGISLIAGGGASAIGSFFSDNVLLVATIAAVTTLFALATAITVRWAMM